MTRTEKLLAEIIALPSVNPAFLPLRHPHAGEKNVADFLASIAARAGLEVEFQGIFPKRSNLIARLFGEDPDRQVREDLRKFKQLMEVGEITTSARRVEDSAYVGSTPTK